MANSTPASRENADHPSVAPMPGLAPWFGGKRNLSKRLVERIEATPHRCYAEPFIGMGGVFLRRRRKAPAEALNDLDGDVVNLFRIVQRHPQALVDALNHQLFARSEFHRLQATDPATLTDVERAARFYVLQRCRYGGRPLSTSFAGMPHPNKWIDRDRLLSHLDRAYRRLERVTIEQLDFGDFLARYDRPDTLFYVDPPYVGLEDVYGPGLFAPADFQRLAAQLKRLKGRFLMSINDAPAVHDAFAWATVEPVPSSYSVNGPQAATELLVSGRC